MYTDMQSKNSTARTLQSVRNKSGQLFRIKDYRRNAIQLFHDKTDYLEYESTPDAMGRANKVRATIKRNGFGQLDGGTPSAKPVGWEWLKTKYGNLTGKWVRFHILNQYMGGRGDDPANLIPTTHHVNHDELWRDFEEYMKTDSQVEDLVFNAEILGYYTVPIGNAGFPRGISANLYTKETGTLIHCYYDSFDLPEGLVGYDIQDLVNVHASLSPEMELPNLPPNISIRNDRMKKRSWSSGEDQTLLVLVIRCGENNWPYIAGIMDRTKAECSQRWSRVLNPRISKTAWTAVEDAKLMGLVGQHGDKAWSIIASGMGNRTDVQCRYHYKFLQK